MLYQWNRNSIFLGLYQNSIVTPLTLVIYQLYHEINTFKHQPVFVGPSA